MLPLTVTLFIINNKLNYPYMITISVYFAKVVPSLILMRLVPTQVFFSDEGLKLEMRIFESS